MYVIQSYAKFVDGILYSVALPEFIKETWSGVCCGRAHLPHESGPETHEELDITILDENRVKTSVSFSQCCEISSLRLILTR